jgi:hypothetical protein
MSLLLAKGLPHITQQSPLRQLRSIMMRRLRRYSGP